MIARKHDYIIGIDPDIEKSGVCLLNRENQEVVLSNLEFPPLIDYLCRTNDEIREQGKTLAVVVEAGYLNKSNWHLTRRDNARTASTKGYYVGRNHEVANCIIKTCLYKGIDTIEFKPLNKFWKGADGKITHEEIANFVGVPPRTNQETRDATLIAWTYAGLPIRVSTKK